MKVIVKRTGEAPELVEVGATTRIEALQEVLGNADSRPAVGELAECPDIHVLFDMDAIYNRAGANFYVDTNCGAAAVYGTAVFCRCALVTDRREDRKEYTMLECTEAELDRVKGLLGWSIQNATYHTSPQKAVHSASVNLFAQKFVAVNNKRRAQSAG